MELLVAADDRTGAYESAAALATHAGPIPVGAWPHVPDAPIAVVDLASRHLTPGEAADRAGALPSARRHAHKIDSTLRGNWAEELTSRAAEHPVLLVPALPEHGRVCIGGTVLEHGRPVHEGRAGTDVRRRVTTSRPAEALVAAGASAVVECHELDDVASWLAAPVGLAVADAADDTGLRAVIDAWSKVDGVVLAGTSAVIGEGVAVTQPGSGQGEPLAVSDGPVLVVCGSVHPVARRQLDHAERRGIPVATIADEITARSLRRAGATILASEIPVGDVEEPMAVAAAATLAGGVGTLRTIVDLGAIVLIGGDTAAAVIGAREATVRGWAAPGAAWLTVDGWGVPIVTRSGGFGSDGALLDLVRDLGGIR